MLRRFVSLGLLLLPALALLASCSSNEFTGQILQAHLSIKQRIPARDSTNVPVLVGGKIVLYDRPSAETWDVTSLTLTDAAGASVPGTIVLLADSIFFNPTAPLEWSSAYRFSLTTGVRMVRGQLQREVDEWGFSTEAAPALAGH